MVNVAGINPHFPAIRSGHRFFQTRGQKNNYDFCDQVNQSGNLYLPYTYGANDQIFAAPAGGTYRMYEVTRSGNISYGYLNGALLGSKDAAISTSDGKVQIGYRSADSALANGDFAELLIYNSYLNDAQRQQVEAYLRAKWLPGSLPPNSALTIAAGATLDVSSITHYTLGTGASLAASGTGTTVGVDAAAITGAASGTVSLGARPVTLNYDSTHPALVVTQGTLSLGGNTFTVVVPGTALGDGVYTLVTTPSAITGTVNAMPSFTGGNGMAAGRTGVVSISANDVILTVTGGTSGYASWAAIQGLNGAPGTDLDPTFNADPNKDGIQNGMAWILGAGALGDPAANLLKLPAVTRDGTGAMVLTFDRLASSAASAPLVVQYGDDLGTTPWTELAVGTSGGTDGSITIAVATGEGLTGTGYDRITVTIPATYMTAHPKTFVRLMATE